jgi:ABC-2 type transport system ATP-binding protein
MTRQGRTPGEPVVTVSDLVKVYRGGVRANDGISLEVHAGEVFGLLGPNGAGKSTLVQQVVGTLRPTSGSIDLCGVDVVANPARGKEFCSVQMQGSVPLAGIRLREALELTARIRGATALAATNATSRLIDLLDLGEWADRPQYIVSGGVGRLTSFAMAVVVPGRLVVLDEPTNDVDPIRREALWDEVRRVAELGAAVLLVTHNVLEAERVVDRLAVVDHGRVVAQGRGAEIKQHARFPFRIDATLVLDNGAVTPALLQDLRRDGRRLRAGIAAEDFPAASSWAYDAQRAGVISEFTLGPVSLHDVYVTAVGATTEEQVGA